MNRLTRFLLGLLFLGLWFPVLHLWRVWHLTAGLRHHSLNAAILAGALSAILLGALGIALAPQRFLQGVLAGLRLRRYVGRGRWFLLAAWVVAFPGVVLYSPVSAKFEPWSARWLGFLITIAGAIFLLAPDDPPDLRFVDVLRAVLLVGATFTFLSAYVNVSSYPFSLSWSEGNRLWDYSLMFARDRYLYPSDKPIFSIAEPGRQFLWGLIYLLPGVNIFWVRFWNALLFTLPALMLAWLAFTKPRLSWSLTFWLGLGGFLFLEQGPIYAPLLLSAVLICFAEGWLSWKWGGLLALVAGYFVGMTRYTWAWAPALWAIMLAIESEQSSVAKRESYLKLGFLVGGSLIGAWLSGAIKVFVDTGWAIIASLLKLPFHGTYVARGAKQPLLWERLWPNPTYPLGIVFGLLLAIAPLVLLWILWKRQGLWQLPPWRWGVHTLILGYFLVVGIIASLKIGGGNNLHNLDMFLIGMLFFTVGLWRQGVADWFQHQRWTNVERVVLLVAVLLPAIPFLRTPPHHVVPRSRWQPVLEAVQEAVLQAQSQGDVLFMDQRQLLTFGFVPQVPLIPEYEKKYMMDKALAGDAEYFAHYYHDLAQHRFALIVTDPFHIYYEGGKGFAAENNAWMKWVVEPTLCFYRPLQYFKDPYVGLLVPRDQPQLGCLTRLPVQPAP